MWLKLNVFSRKHIPCGKFVQTYICIIFMLKYSLYIYYSLQFNVFTKKMILLIHMLLNKSLLHLLKLRTNDSNTGKTRFQVREERFRYTSESTNLRVFWWSIVQVLALIVIGIWQSLHMKSFFINKKLV